MDSKIFRKYANIITEAEASDTDPVQGDNDAGGVANINDIAAHMKFLPTSKKAKQYKFVKDGKPGKMPPMSYTQAHEEMPVVTMTADGQETKNKADPGDVIMSGPSGENYVVKGAKFPKLYQGDIGQVVIPEQGPRQVAVYSGHSAIKFIAPWGEEMVLKPGDYLVKDGDDGYYRIAKKEYEETYNQPGHTGGSMDEEVLLAKDKDKAPKPSKEKYPGTSLPGRGTSREIYPGNSLPGHGSGVNKPSKPSKYGKPSSVKPSSTGVMESKPSMSLKDYLNNTDVKKKLKVSEGRKDPRNEREANAALVGKRKKSKIPPEFDTPAVKKMEIKPDKGKENFPYGNPPKIKEATLKPKLVKVNHNKVYHMINALAIACIKGKGWDEGAKDFAKMEAENDAFWSDYVDEVTSALESHLNDKNRMDYNAPIEALEMAIENVAENIVEYFENPMNFGPGGGALKKGSLRVDTSKLTDELMLKAIKKVTGRDITKEETEQVDEVSADRAKLVSKMRKLQSAQATIKGLTSVHGDDVAKHAAEADRLANKAARASQHARRKEVVKAFKPRP